MPRNYWFYCTGCGGFQNRYRNAKCCTWCGGELKRETLSPWQKIMRAADEGAGLHLSPDEIIRLSMDGAIEALATQDDNAEAARLKGENDGEHTDH